MPNRNSGTQARDVVVIGGGLAGCSAAYFLAREGVDTLVLERGEINSGASGANAGSIHLQIPSVEFRELGSRWVESFVPALKAMKVGSEFWEQLESILGADLGFRKTGGLIAATNEYGIRLVAEKAEVEKAQGIEVEMLDRNQIFRKANYLSHRVGGGAFYPGEGKADPLLATSAFASKARDLGAEIKTSTPVVGITSEKCGFRVETGSGTISARRIICAAGAHSRSIASMVGIDLQIREVPIQVAVTEATSPLVGHLLYSAEERLTLKQMNNGTCLIGGGWPAVRNQNGRLSVNCASLAANLKLAAELVPSLASLRIVRVWPAAVNGTKDWLPILGEAPSVPGFHFNFFPWMGFTGSPIAALAVVETMMGRKPPFDISGMSPPAPLNQGRN